MDFQFLGSSPPDSLIHRDIESGEKNVPTMLDIDFRGRGGAVSSKRPFDVVEGGRRVNCLQKVGNAPRHR